MITLIFGIVYILTVLVLVFWGYTPSAQALNDAYNAKVFREGFFDVMDKSFAYIELRLATDENAADDEDLMLFAESIGYLYIGNDKEESEDETV
jgi:hypothetical protein